MVRISPPDSDGKPSAIGQVCYETFFGRNAPCENCPAFARRLGDEVVTAVVPRQMRKSSYAVVSAVAVSETEIVVTRFPITPDIMSALLAARIEEFGSAADLSPKEGELLQLLLLGRTSGEIAAELGVSERTAKYHQRKVLVKLGAESRFDLFRLLL